MRFTNLARLLDGRILGSDGSGSRGGYDPHQPRVPKGHSDGGQWTRLSDLGSPQSFDDQIVGEERAPNDRPEGWQLVRDTYNYPVTRNPRVSSRELVPWLLGYNFAAATDRIGQRQTIIEFARDESGAFSYERHQQLDWEEGKERCNELENVHDVAAKAAETVRTAFRSLGLPETGPRFGTAVHGQAATQIRENHPHLRAELSFWNGEVELSEKEYNDLNEDQRASVTWPLYGKKGSIRVDVFEKMDDGTICVYDIKTANAILSPRRIRQILAAVAKAYGADAVKRVVITEVRVR